jgi:hypothetical protein
MEVQAAGGINCTTICGWNPVSALMTEFFNFSALWPFQTKPSRSPTKFTVECWNGRKNIQNRVFLLQYADNFSKIPKLSFRHLETIESMR